MKLIEDLGWGKPKEGGGDFQKEKGGTQLFKLNLGIDKDKNEDILEKN